MENPDEQELTAKELAEIDQQMTVLRDTSVTIPYPIIAKVINRNRRMHRLVESGMPPKYVGREVSLLREALIELDEYLENTLHLAGLGERPERMWRANPNQE